MGLLWPNSPQLIDTFDLPFSRPELYLQVLVWILKICNSSNYLITYPSFYKNSSTINKENGLP